VRFVCISDTHNQLKSVAIPDGDVLLHAGDLTKAGSVNDIAEQFRLLNKMPHEHVVAIAGNHDRAFQSKPELAALYRRRYPRVHYLNGESAVIAGIKIWGSPWTPWFEDWAFNFAQGPEGERQAARHYATIPSATQLLLTHGPPREILDQLDHHGSDPGAHVGAIALRERVGSLPQLRAHIFGHIHNAHGLSRVGNVLFVNAAICDELYQPSQAPIVIDWDGERFDVAQ
jgi:Icc-related predicted phosphoesterase